MDNKMSNAVYLAGAGSGKTTLLVKKAIETAKKDTVLITTFTDSNAEEITSKIYSLCDYIPENITVQTWFTFLIQHGIHPYQNYADPSMETNDIKGLAFESARSGLLTKNEKFVYQIPERNFKRYYFTNDWKIHSDKLAKLAFRCNEKSEGKVINRISKIFQNIFIDEVQDLSGYDLDIVALLFKSSANVIIVGDPRQVTYTTHNEQRNKKYDHGKIGDYLIENKIIKASDVDDKTLNVSHRCNEAICSYASKIYEHQFETMHACACCHNSIDKKQGIFFICEHDIQNYLRLYNAIQLRHDRRQNINNEFKVMSFGESKGRTFENTLLYPTEPIKKWMLNHSYDLTDDAKSKFYVALTRAKNCVCIVWKETKQPNDIIKWPA